MDPKYFKKNCLILAHLRIDSFDTFILKLNNAIPDKEAGVTKCKEAELVDFTGNGITNEVFSKIFASFPFTSVTELYLVIF